MFVAFLEPKIQSTFNESLPTPPNQSKVVGTNKWLSSRVYLCYVLSQGLAYIIKACLRSEINTSEN